MTTLLFAFLLQSLLVLPPRTAMENPAVVSEVPPKIAKDYALLWARFIAGNEDAKLEKDLDNLLKKQKTFDPALTIAGYIRLYMHDDTSARQKFTQAVAINPKNRIAVYYLAEIAFVHQEYAPASILYGQLMAMDSPYPDVETKRERALLRATEEVLQTALRAETDNRLADAEQIYRQTLTMLPKEALVHQHLADLLARENKPAEAESERKLAEELMPRGGTGYPPPTAEPSSAGDVDTLDDLGRWDRDINRFHEIRSAESVTREQLAALLVRYFPQLTESRQKQEIVTDTQNSWASAEIQTIVGLGLMTALPNHTFEPSGLITRGDLAQTLARLIRLLGVSPAVSQPNSAPDLDSTDALYPETQLVLGSGVMTLQDSGSFNVSGLVSGKEAVRSTERLLRIFQQAPH